MGTRIGRSVSVLLLAIAIVAAIPGVAVGEAGFVAHDDAPDFVGYTVVITGQKTTTTELCDQSGLAVYSAVFTQVGVPGPHLQKPFKGEIGLYDSNVKPGTRYDITAQGLCSESYSDLQLVRR